ncbi:Lrp/AsnC ligand binding domain-containing protein [Vibrio astriarenae]
MFVEDMDHFARFIRDQLLAHPAVIDVKSSFALERIKDTTALPVVV